jgi:plastocyanin
MRRTITAVFIATGLLIFTACSSGNPDAKSSAPATVQSSRGDESHEVVPQEPQLHKILIQGFRFQPADLTVSLGDTVEFTNGDIVPHNAVAHGRFDSGKLPRGASWKFLAKEKGTFQYVCTLHPNMKGKLIVR